MSDIVNDLANLTSFSVLSTGKILSRYQDCICYDLQQNLENIKDAVELDIYIGKLIVKQEEDKLLYKFIPSNSFEKDIIDTVINKESPLVKKLENLVTDKITGAYKEFF